MSIVSFVKVHYNCLLHVKNAGFFCEDLTEYIDGALNRMAERIKLFKGFYTASKEENDDSESSESGEPWIWSIITDDYKAYKAVKDSGDLQILNTMFC